MQPTLVSMVRVMDSLDDLLAAPVKPQPKVRLKQPAVKKNVKDRLTRDAVKSIMVDALAGQESDLKALAKTAGRPDSVLIREAFTNFETAIGGREALVSVLMHCPPTSVGGQMIGKLLVDPEFTSTNAYTLQVLCKKHKLPFNAMVQAFRDAKLAQVAIATLNQVAGHVPEVVEQLVVDATNRWEGCTICDGTGRIHRINEAGEFAHDSEGSPITQLCFDCRGKGRKYVRHDFANRSKLLDLAGLRPDKGPLVQQTFNQQANIAALGNAAFMPGDGSFENLMQAIETTLRPTTLHSQPELVLEALDAEIIVREVPQEADPEGSPDDQPEQ